MPEHLRLAVAGVGNNIAALMQGGEWYRQLIATGASIDALPGLRAPVLCGIAAWDFDIVAAYDVSQTKVGVPLDEAVMAPPNNYPALVDRLTPSKVQVAEGIVTTSNEEIDAVAESLRNSGAEVLLYSLPTGLQSLATAYAKAALRAGVALVNCTPELVARDPEMMAAFTQADLPLVGDDLASHLGASVVHRELLSLVAQRGLTLDGSYQVNLGGNEDFRNLTSSSESKRTSKMNALRRAGIESHRVHVVPSGGHIPYLQDTKVCHISIESLGWGGTRAVLDVKLQVQDSSNAAGVIIDLIRVAAAGRRSGRGGELLAAAPQLKSPLSGHGYCAADIEDAYLQIQP